LAADYNSSLVEYNLRNFNKRASLDLIRFTAGGISRADLARQLGLTRAAVTTIISDLIEQGLVREAEDAPTAGGRKPIMLEINSQRGLVIGIDIGATHASLLMTDFSTSAIDEIEISLDIRSGPDACLPVIDAQLRGLLEKNRLELSDIQAIGIGVPGPVVAEAGIVSAPPIMPGWDRYPIRSHLDSMWNRPISLNNDAELGALGEWAQGAGRGERHLAYIKVGTGIGAGLLLNGKIYGGVTGSAGEIGHVTIRDDGPLCNCGNRGCLEALAGGQAIAEKAKAAIRSGRRTQISTLSSLEKVSAKEVALAARMGDLVAQQIMSEAGSYLGIAIASLVNLFNPGMVVIGGGVAQMGDLLLEPIRKAVQERSLRSASQAVRITAALLGRRSSSMGAVVQALNIALDKFTEYP
jgi:glucokinase-like ROK family protein